jgi:hypothetical protein
MARGCREGVQKSFHTLEDADREWLISVFASVALERGGLDTLLAWRAEREMRRRPSGLPIRGLRNGDRRLSPKRREDDLSRAAGRLSAT